MDQLTNYRAAIKQTLTDFSRGSYLPPQYMREVTAFDETADRYLVVVQGWDGKEYVNDIRAEVDMEGGKVYIRANNTDSNLVQLLVANGVAEQDIIISYLQHVQ